MVLNAFLFTLNFIDILVVYFYHLFFKIFLSKFP